MMSIMPPTHLASVSGGVWQQMQQQQAQRTADQAEMSARVLQRKASEARTKADEAEENARDLRVRSEQADGKAGKARQHVEALRSFNDIQGRLQSLREGIATGLENISTAASPKGVLNAEGQATGTLVNVTA